MLIKQNVLFTAQEGMKKSVHLMYRDVSECLPKMFIGHKLSMNKHLK